MSVFRFFLLFIIFISCINSFSILNPAKIPVQIAMDYFETLSDESLILVLEDDYVEETGQQPLTFLILDADGNILRSITRPFDGYHNSFYSILALQNNNFVFVFKTKIKTIVFEIYDQFLNLIKGEKTVKYSRRSTNDISNEVFDPTVFKLNNGGFGIIYQRDGLTQYINFYDQDGNFISNSPETFPLVAQRTYPFHTSAVQMLDNNILFIVEDSIQNLHYFKSLRSKNVELCASEEFDCCGHELNNINMKRMKNGMVLITWVRADSLTFREAYFTIFDSLCSKKILETKIGITFYEPRIECLENGNCVIIYFNEIYFPSNIQIVFRILDSRTNTLGTEIVVAKTDSLDYMISSYSNSNFMIVFTDVLKNEIVGKVYSLDCLEYVDEECQSCTNSKVFSKGKKACVTPIEGCEEYSADGKCTTCTSPNILTVDGICAPEIEFCLTYANDGKCLFCTESHRLILDNTACGSIIAGCVLYSADGQTCLK